MGQKRPLVGGSTTDMGGRSSRGLANCFHVSVKRSCKGMGLGKGTTIAAVYVAPRRHVLDPALGAIQIYNWPDQLGNQEEGGGILPHCLYLLVANEGELGNLGGLYHRALAMRDEATHSPRSCETKGSRKLLARVGPSQVSYLAREGCPERTA